MWITALFGVSGILWLEGNLSTGIVGTGDTQTVVQCADRKESDNPRSINMEGHVLEAHQGVVGGSVSGNINQVKGEVQAMRMC